MVRTPISLQRTVQARSIHWVIDTFLFSQRRRRRRYLEERPRNARFASSSSPGLPLHLPPSCPAEPARILTLPFLMLFHLSARAVPQTLRRRTLLSSSTPRDRLNIMLATDSNQQEKSERNDALIPGRPFFSCVLGAGHMLGLMLHSSLSIFDMIIIR